MPHLSKKKLSVEKQKNLEKQLIRLFKSIRGDRKARAVLHEILTDTERLMIAKRLAVIILLERNRAPYAIGRMLGISPSTIARMSLKHDIGAYNSVALLFKKKGFLEILESILQAGLPPRGRGRWQFLQKY